MNIIAIKPSYSFFFNTNPQQQKPFKRPPPPCVVVSCKRSSNNNDHTNKRFKLTPINPLSLFIQTIRNLAKKAAKQRWPTTTHRIKTEFLHNGGIGMALITVKTTAKNKFSPFVATLAANPTFMSGLLACILAQSLKIGLNFIVERKWDWRLLCASGGMPSSHSALCTALTTSVALCHGVADSLFPVCLGFSSIVMYDAIGVRRHAGMQAEVLNKIIEDLFQGHPISERKLKELLGHTLSQVVAGALLGIVVACFCCQGCLVPI